MAGLRLLLLSSVLFVAACGGGGSSPQAVAPPDTSPASVYLEILQSSVDPSVDTAFEAHVAINPSPDVTPAGKLFVFLPGTGGSESGTKGGGTNRHEVLEGPRPRKRLHRPG